MLIHLINLALEEFGGHVSLGLEGRRHAVVLLRHKFGARDKHLWLLQTAQLLFLGEALHLLFKVDSKVCIVAQLLERLVLEASFLAGPSLDGILLREDNSDDIVLQGVTVDEALGDQWREAHDLLNLFGGDVLSLRQLEYVL